MLPLASPAEVTQWGPRVLLTLGVLAVIALAVFGMRHGWRTRLARQTDIAAPAPPPARLPEDAARVPGLYIATTRAGDLLDRIVAHDLGHRGRAEMVVTPGGLLIEREGERAIWIPLLDLKGARLGSGQAQKAFEPGGLLLITWALGDHLVESGFRADSTAAHEETARSIAAMIHQQEGSR